MAFVSYSFLRDGAPNPLKLSSEDTYITVAGLAAWHLAGTRVALDALKSNFNILYEGPAAFNHYHDERNTPSQRMYIFEKKCEQPQKPVPAVPTMVKTPGKTT